MRKTDAKFRLIDTGRGTYLELDGKSMGTGITSVSYEKVGYEPAKLNIGIDLGDFGFMPDGHFDEVENKLKEIELPTE